MKLLLKLLFASSLTFAGCSLYSASDSNTKNDCFLSISLWFSDCDEYYSTYSYVDSNVYYDSLVFDSLFVDKTLFYGPYSPCSNKFIAELFDLEINNASLGKGYFNLEFRFSDNRIYLKSLDSKEEVIKYIHDVKVSLLDSNEKRNFLEDMQSLFEICN